MTINTNTSTISLQDFELFKGNVKNKIKADGQLNFIQQTLISDEIETLWNKNNILCSLYLLSMVDYLSRLNEIPLYTKYDYIRNHKMEQIVYPLSFKTYSTVMGISEKDITENAIPEFLTHNIVEGDVFNVQ